MLRLNSSTCRTRCSLTSNTRAGWRRAARTAGGLLLWYLCTSGSLAATLTEHLDLACTQPDTNTLDCAYRLLRPGSLQSAAAETGDVVVAGELGAGYPAADDTTGLLIVVDTSDPARQPVIDRIIGEIRELLDQLQPHHRVGLASFDTDLFLLADLGSAKDEVARAAAGLEARGRTTELFRNVREAVRLAARHDGGRRAIVLMSDGLAEDYAYHHEDVVDLARREGVVIHAIGYPRSVAKSVALQTIRRLADETGGIYVQANHVDYSIPAGVAQRLLAATDSGGSVRFDLAAFVDAGMRGPHDLSLAFQTAEQSIIVLAPVRLGDNGIPLPAATTPPAAPRVAPAPAPRISPPAGTGGLASTWLIALVVLLVAILLTVMAVLLRLRRQAGVPSNTPPSAATPLAWLILINGDDVRRIAIDHTPWRIGRGRGSDLVLDDHSVSRLHADIRLADDGRIILSDLESLNGVFVNDNRIDSIQLREGDSVDIGDVRLEFTLHDVDYESEEPTVLVRTRTPV